MKKILYFCSVLLSACIDNPVKVDPKAFGKDIAELNAYRNSASARCSGTSYSYALGSSSGLNSKIQAEVSENLFSKGYGTGGLDIGVTLQEKSELANLLGNLTQNQIEDFLKRYQSCMDKDMESFYRTKGMSYPEKAETKTTIWDSQILTVETVKTANRTEKSGNWRSYRVCATIPDNAFMLKDTVKTEVISGVAAGTWGDWRKDLEFTNNNSYGPTMVCRDFDHQIHDQDRVLKISVNYKLPK